MRELKQRILDRVQEDLEAIETALRAHLDPNLELVGRVAGHILFSGGKRMRPLMMILCARMCGCSDPRLPTYATIFEYLHAATLLHDDLVDGARLRRGRTVAHDVWDGPTAVLTGDFLLARSLQIAAETGKIGVIRTLSDVTAQMSQGEIQQLHRKGWIDLSETEYMQIIRAKTAVLFQGACRVSALVADAPTHLETALAEYGYQLGMAFQMADDLLDYTLDSQALGKQVGADLREGKLTLPVIRALQAADPEGRRQMAAIIGDDDFSPDDFQRLVDMLERYDGIGYTRRQAAAAVHEAKGALAVFAPSQFRDILMDVADYALLRRA